MLNVEENWQNFPFAHKAVTLGFDIAQPYGDSECYEFILGSYGRFSRVQVKSAHAGGGARATQN